MLILGSQTEAYLKGAASPLPWPQCQPLLRLRALRCSPSPKGMGHTCGCGLVAAVLLWEGGNSGVFALVTAHPFSQSRALPPNGLKLLFVLCLFGSMYLAYFSLQWNSFGRRDGEGLTQGNENEACQRCEQAEKTVSRLPPCRDT